MSCIHFFVNQLYVTDSGYVSFFVSLLGFCIGGRYDLYPAIRLSIDAMPLRDRPETWLGLLGHQGLVHLQDG